MRGGTCVRCTAGNGKGEVHREGAFVEPIIQRDHGDVLRVGVGEGSGEGERGGAEGVVVATCGHRGSCQQIAHVHGHICAGSGVHRYCDEGRASFGNTAAGKVEAYHGWCIIVGDGERVLRLRADGRSALTAARVLHLEHDHSIAVVHPVVRNRDGHGLVRRTAGGEHHHLRGEAVHTCGITGKEHHIHRVIGGAARVGDLQIDRRGAHRFAHRGRRRSEELHRGVRHARGQGAANGESVLAGGGRVEPPAAGGGLTGGIVPQRDGHPITNVLQRADAGEVDLRQRGRCANRDGGRTDQGEVRAVKAVCELAGHAGGCSERSRARESRIQCRQGERES